MDEIVYTEMTTNPDIVTSEEGITQFELFGDISYFDSAEKISQLDSFDAPFAIAEKASFSQKNCVEVWRAVEIK